MKPKRFMRIVNAREMDGRLFIPVYIRYEVIYTNDKFVALGINGKLLHKMRWEDVEDYN